MNRNPSREDGSQAAAAMRVLIFDGPQTRGTLAARLGLGVGQAGGLLDRLGRAGVVQPAPAPAALRGRPPRTFRAVADRGYVLGLSLGLGLVSGAAFDLGWQTLARTAIRRPLIDLPAQAILDTVLEAAERLMREGRLPRERCLAIGCGVWGSARRSGEVTLFWPYRRDLRDVPLVATAGSHFGVPAVADDGVRYRAQELLYRRPAVRDFLYVSELGALAAVHDGTVQRGSSGFGGELGHFVVDPSGPPCECGDRGCLLAVASSEALLRRIATAAGPGLHPALRGLLRRTALRGPRPGRARDAGDSGWGELRGPSDVDRAAPTSTPPPSEGVATLSAPMGDLRPLGQRTDTYAALLAAAEDGDRLANRLLVEVGTGLGRAVATAINILGLETVIVSGDLLGRTPVAQEALRRTLRLHVVELLQPRMQVSYLIPMAEDGLLGAAQQALSHALSRRPLAEGTRRLLLGA
ncbi:MAG TPA: ROK family protein [Chloroflexota bacterium]|jgi:predicted NBD/HSP70 family sugar kinase|nr:ROK family protein [Chloroflexota bacterium]